MLTKTQLLDFDGSRYTTVIQRWGQAADAVSSASSTISGMGGQMTNWTGPAANQALTTMGDLVSVVASSPGLLNEAQDTLAAFVVAINQQQDILKSVIAKADALQCTVGEDGTVTPPPAPVEPPQACLPDPVAEAARVKAQEAYDNWQSVADQGARLQTAAQEALQAASAADSRASGELEAGVQGGSDVQHIVTGQDPTGSYTANLYADTQRLADGQKWVQQYVKQAAVLLPKAAAGDSAAAAQLATLRALSYDQDFGAALMNQLGAAGLEKLPLEMGQKVQAIIDNPGDPADLRTLLLQDQAVLHFLGDSLASASNSPNLSPAFVAGLTNNDTVVEVDSRLPGPAGFWSLGQILGASTGAVQYDPAFLDTVGTAIIHYDGKQAAMVGYEGIGPFSYPWANNLDLSANAILSQNSFHGITDVGGDPIYGLMHAAAFSPAAAQALFTSHGNLNIVLTQLPWNFDQGSALGAALQAATSGPGAVTASITSNIVHTLALQYQNDSGYAAQMAGLNSYVAKILAQPQSIMAINRTIGEGIQAWPDTSYRYIDVNGQGGLGPGFNGMNLAEVLGVISQTPAAYHILQTAQVSYMTAELDQAVAAARNAPGGISGAAGSSLIGQALDQGTTNLAFLGEVKAVVGQDNANASAAALQHNLQTASFITSLLSAATGPIPGAQAISVSAGVVSTVLGQIGSGVQASTAPTVTGAQREISLGDLSRIALVDALLKHHVQVPTDLDSSQFLGPDGQLLSPETLITKPGALPTMGQWLEQLPAVGASDYNQVVINELASGYHAAVTNLTASGS